MISAKKQAREAKKLEALSNPAGLKKRKISAVVVDAAAQLDDAIVALKAARKEPEIAG